jgi:spore coat protein U-like protein
MRVIPLRLLVIFCTLVFGACQALAQSCTLGVTGVNFGSVNLLSGAAYDGAATFNISCSNPGLLAATFRICPNIEAGAGGASGATRQMQNAAAQTLNFQLYQDAARTVPWGSSTATQFGAPPTIDVAVNGLGQTTTSKTVYARVLSNQQATLGGPYSSVFSGANTRFNYKAYYLATPALCSTISDNPAQAPFTVQANVDRTCNVTAQNINFGNRGFLTAAIDAPGGLSVTCTLNLPYSISLDGGTSGATSPTQRKMVLNGAAVIYGLYQDAARTLPWGTAVGQIVTGTGTGAVQNLAIYGRVEAQTTPVPGTYTDTVVATVTY